MPQLPTVTGSFGQTPELTFPDSPAPKGLHIKVLEKGTGPTVTTGRELQANYHGQIWGGGVFDSSFQRGTPATFPIGVGAVIQGWDQGIVGKNVGSRLLISIPPEKGYGAAGQPAAGIGGTDTLVFVVDLVGVQ
ncbi:MAG: FKBP-type peptidyl-prolyl cis-trans isomerase [Ancrocorticia sp.]|uniref:FKBP-type peptidyl-prolyl cis-trans isomerase n=1 Tax=Ancrocorticia sp. TaxID=2593684 RepID=UPI003F93609A